MPDEDVIPMPMQEGSYRIPRSIIDAVSDIQQYTVMESEGISDIPESFLTLRRYLAYTNIGFVYGFGDNIIVWLVSPFLYGVLFNMIPIFGRTHLGIFDKVFAFILGKYITVGLLALMIMLLSKAKGTLSRGCANAIVVGYLAALMIRACVFLFVYRYLYQVWPSICSGIYMLGDKISRFLPNLADHVQSAAMWLLSVRSILLTTSNYETLFSLFMVLTLVVIVAVKRVSEKGINNPYYGRFG